MRVAVPELGVVVTASLRVTIAGLALLGFARLQAVPMLWRANVRSYAIVGFFSAAFPFSCFSYASQFLPTAYSAVLNATAPLFGALFSIVWLADRLTVRKLSGLLLGIIGVAILVGAGALDLNPQTLSGALACLAAAASYAISSILMKKVGQNKPVGDAAPTGIHPYAMACGSMLLGGVMLAPAVPFSLPHHIPSPTAVACMIALALLATGVAQAIFIPLISRIGPTKAMTVTFLIPMFSMLWGYLFLHETVSISTIVGAAIILSAMGLILNAAAAPKPALK
ncbi:DMT family transporter [Undibacterium sp. Jales W-56]|nr:DMT family transporter [Undibacterium sp. Jales W-56]